MDTGRVSKAFVADLPKPATGIGKAKDAPLASSQVASPRDELMRLFQSLNSLRPVRQRGTPATVQMAVDAIIGCVRAPELDFTGVSDNVAQLLASMPVSAWLALQQHALQQLPAGISSVTLPAKLSACLSPGRGDDFVPGLAQLQGMTQLVVVDPPAGSIDLTALGRAVGASLAIQVNCFGKPQKWEFSVSAGVSVHATASFPSHEKSSVLFVGDDGVVQSRTLAGLIYDHQSKDADIEMPRDINLNLEGRYPNGDAIECRDLAVHWLKLRRLHREAGGADFLYRPLVTVENINSGIDPHTPAEFERIHLEGGQSLVEAGQFGTALAWEFGHMRVGETRQLLFEVAEHVFAVELQAKPRSGGGELPGEEVEFVVDFYDPNSTAVHQRLVVSSPDQVVGRPLGHWLPQDDMDFHFGEGAPTRIGCMLIWFEAGQPPPHTDPGDFLRHVPVEHRSWPYVLYRAMQEGKTQDTVGILNQIHDLCHARQLDAAGLGQWLTAAGGAGPPALMAALAFGRAPVVEQYVGWLLNRLAAFMEPQQTLELLGAVHEGKPGLRHALDETQEEAVRTYTRLVAAAPHTAIDTDMRLALLLARAPAADAGGEPMLHAITAQALEPAAEVRQAETVFGYLQEVMASRDLSDAHKNILCVAGHDGSTAAQAFVAAGKVGAAGAMACAIVEADADPQKKARLLAGLGIDLAALLVALEESGLPDHARWSGPITAWQGAAALAEVAQLAASGSGSSNHGSMGEPTI